MPYGFFWNPSTARRRWRDSESEAVKRRAEERGDVGIASHGEPSDASKGSSF